MEYRPRQLGRSRIRDRLLNCATQVNAVGQGLLDTIRKNSASSVATTDPNRSGLDWSCRWTLGKLRG